MNLSRLAFGYATSQILYATVSLGLPEALSQGPVPVTELARRVGCDADGLGRLLRALVVLGVADEPSPDMVGLAPAAAPLRADHPRSMRSAILLYGDPAMWAAWGSLTAAVRTGTAAFDHAHGRPLFEHLARDPAGSTVFNAAMSQGTGWLAAEVPKAYDFSGGRTVLDIGGGSGALLAAVLAATPDARGVLYDTPSGAAGAAETFRRAGLSSRCAVETGDFFTAVPVADLMLLKGILHDWDDARCGTLLANCRRSIAPDGHLLVVEPVLPDRLDAPDAAAAVMSDIAMLVYTGGRERTVPEYRKLLAANGFELTDVTRPLAGTGIRVLVADPHVCGVDGPVVRPARSKYPDLPSYEGGGMAYDPSAALREAGLISGVLRPELEDFFSSLNENEVQVLVSLKNRLSAVLPDVEAHSQQWTAPEATQEGFDAAMLCACAIWSGAGAAAA